MNLSENHNISLWKTCGKTWKICGKPVEKPPKLLTGINTLWKSGQVIHSFSTGGNRLKSSWHKVLTITFHSFHSPYYY